MFHNLDTLYLRVFIIIIYLFSSCIFHMINSEIYVYIANYFINTLLFFLTYINMNALICSFILQFAIYL